MRISDIARPVGTGQAAPSFGSHITHPPPPLFLLLSKINWQAELEGRLAEASAALEEASDKVEAEANDVQAQWQAAVARGDDLEAELEAVRAERDAAVAAAAESAATVASFSCSSSFIAAARPAQIETCTAS